VGSSPKTVVWRRGKAQLVRYESDRRTRRPPVLIIWSIVSRAYILDLRRGRSFIGQMLDDGVDVFMIDWGEPAAIDAGNTLETYVDNYLPRALDRVLEVADASELDLVGYCFGGVLALLGTAGIPDAPVKNLAVMATPADFTKAEGIVQALARGSIEVDHLLDETGNVPGKTVERGFASLRPTADVFKYAALWERLWDDEFVDGYQAMAGWVSDQVPMPGAIAKQLAELFLRRNLMASGTVPLGGRAVRLADITCPFLNIIADHDHLVVPQASEGLNDLVGSQDNSTLRIPAGHIGLAAGRDATKVTVPGLLAWLNERSA
jgi:polyhydroxyalkanoate synthase